MLKVPGSGCNQATPYKPGSIRRLAILVRSSISKDNSAFIKTIRSPSPKTKHNTTIAPQQTSDKKTQNLCGRLKTMQRESSSSERAISYSFNQKVAHFKNNTGMQNRNLPFPNIYSKFRKSPEKMDLAKENSGVKAQNQTQPQIHVPDTSDASALQDLCEVRNLLNDLHQALSNENFRFRTSMENYRAAVVKSLDDIKLFLTQLKSNFISNFEKRFKHTGDFLARSLRTVTNHRTAIERTIAKIQISGKGSLSLSTLVDELVIPIQPCPYPQFSETGKDDVLGRIFALSEELCTPNMTVGSLNCIENFNAAMKESQKKLAKVSSMTVLFKNGTSTRRPQPENNGPLNRELYDFPKKNIEGKLHNEVHPILKGIGTTGHAFKKLVSGTTNQRFSATKNTASSSKQDQVFSSQTETSKPVIRLIDKSGSQLAKIKQVLTLDDQELEGLEEVSETVSRLSLRDNGPDLFIDEKDFVSKEFYRKTLDVYDRKHDRKRRRDEYAVSPIYTCDEGFGTHAELCESLEVPNPSSNHRRIEPGQHISTLDYSMSLNCSEDLGEMQ
jgi:hypothetical protein